MTARFQGFLASKAPQQLSVILFTYWINDYIDMPKVRICRPLVGSFSFSNAGGCQWRPRIAVSSLGRHWTGCWIRPSRPWISVFGNQSEWWCIKLVCCYIVAGDDFSDSRAENSHSCAKSDRRHHWLTGSVSFAQALLVIIITSV